MTISVRATPTRAELILWVRREVRDPAVNADGSARPEVARAWPDAEVVEALQDAIIELQIEQASRGWGQFIREAELEMVDGQVDVPASADGVLIESLQAQAQDRWISILRGGENAPDDEVLNEFPVFYRWHLRAKEGAGASGFPSARIVVVPDFSGRVRLRYWDPTAIPTSDADAHSIARLWGELVALLAARTLLARDEDFTMQQEQALMRKMDTYKQFHRPKAKRIRKIPR